VPVYKFNLDSPRRLRGDELALLDAALANAWATIRRQSDRHAELAPTMHARHLERAELWAIHPKGHALAGEPIYSDEDRRPHLFCSDCGRTLIGHGRVGGLICPEVADHPDKAEPCHETCVIECGERHG
jgi:hypothetical protein